MQRICVGIVLAAMVAACVIAREASAQYVAPSQQPTETAKDYNQRSLEIYEFRKAAKSGPDRGEEIFYYKCWFCHNEFTKDIPKLTGLYKRPNMLSGKPVSDEAVKEQIKNGSANMAAYKYTLSDADIDDLVAYVREK